MDIRSIEQMMRGCAGELVRGVGTAPVSRVCADSRQVKPGDAFFALSGARFDGHNFLSEAHAKGAVLLVIARSRFGPGLPECAILLVDDPRKALGRYAAAYRSELPARVIVVGGSNGKTSTKELVAAVLRQKIPTVWSEASFNNDIGVPLTLLSIGAAHQAAVVEVGTNHPGELAPLVRMAQPQLGVITCIGREHLEFFGGLDGVAREEGMLAELLPTDGTLFINGDDPYADALAKRTAATAIRVGFGDRNDWRARAVRPDTRGAHFRVECPHPASAGEYRLNLLGRHQVINALFAIAVGAEFGLGAAEIQNGLAECKPAKMRLQLWELNGVRVLDDAYNANADSMVCALRTMQEFPCKGRRVAVLGDMAELGSYSEAAHEEVGRCAAESGVGQLFAVGKWASVMARGARAGGLHRVIEFDNVEAAAAAVCSFLKQGDLLLLKASRAARLERIAELLRLSEIGKKN